MAEENNIGQQGKLTNQSLEHYNESGVLQTMYKFRDSIVRFTELSDGIVEVKNRLKSYWDGIAHDEFHNRFQRVFSQVRDMGDALGDVYDMLNKAQLEFYKTDDSFAEQLKEAIHNTSGGGGQSTGGSSETYAAQTGSPYTPSLLWDPLPSKPVLVSTMGEAYVPDLSYETMTKKPVLSSCIGSALLAVLTMQSMSAQETITHHVEQALLSDQSYTSQTQQDELASVISEPVVPDLSYSPLSPKDELVSTMGEAYVPVLGYVPLGGDTSVSSVVAGVITADVVTTLLNVTLTGGDRASIVSRLGEAVVSHLTGTYTPEQRTALVTRMGETLYGQFFTSTDGGAATPTMAPLADVPAWTASLPGMIAAAVFQTMPPAVMAQVAPDIDTLLKTGGGTVSLVQGSSYFGGVTSAVQVATFGGLSDLNAGMAKQVAAMMADYSNGQSIRGLIQGSVSEQLGGGKHVSLPTSVTLAASQDSLTIQITASPSQSFNMSALVAVGEGGASLNLGAVGDTVKAMCASCTTYDFTGITFPVAA